jgi:hypothetical protein
MGESVLAMRSSIEEIRRSLETDVDSELDRVGEGHASLKPCVRGVDQAEKFVCDIEIHRVGDLPDKSGADGKGGVIGLFELIGGLGVIDLGDLKLGVGKAKPGG